MSSCVIILCVTTTIYSSYRVSQRKCLNNVYSQFLSQPSFTHQMYVVFSFQTVAASGYYGIEISLLYKRNLKTQTLFLVG